MQKKKRIYLKKKEIEIKKKILKQIVSLASKVGTDK